jgi:uncharacterized protein YggE
MTHKMNPDRNVNQKNCKGFLVASILLGAGLLSATILGAQFFSPSAVAQESTDGGNGTTVELDCPPDAVICEQQIDDGSTTGSLDDNTARATVSTSGSASTKVEPDKVSVTIGVETNGTTAQEAASKNADLTADILAALIELGIPEEQTSTSNYNVYPTYSQKLPMTEPTDVCIMIYPPPPECQPNQEITGYIASNSLTVTLDVAGTIDGGQVIDTAIEAGANTVNGVYFFISSEKQEEIRDGLIGEAIENARHRADVAATAVGMEVSGVKSVNLNDVYFPFFSSGFDASLKDGAPAQLLPGEQEVTMTVSVAYYMS